MPEHFAEAGKNVSSTARVHCHILLKGSPSQLSPIFVIKPDRSAMCWTFGMKCEKMLPVLEG
eukprot:2170394-Prorocentrum_lima.AAC.1